MEFNIPTELSQKSGVYIIRNIINNKYYVGSAINLYDRWKVHRDDINRGGHHSESLQMFVFNFGIDCLILSLLEEVENNDNLNKEDFRKKLLGREQFYLDTLKPFDDNGFNKCRIAGSTYGTKVTEQGRKNISESKKNPSEETRQKMRESGKVKIFTTEHKEKIRNSKLGDKNSFFNRKHVPESIQKMRDDKLGVKRTSESKRKQAISVTRSGNHKSRIVLNLENGVFYGCIKDAWEARGFEAYTTLKARLGGYLKNNTSFIYA